MNVNLYKILVVVFTIQCLNMNGQIKYPITKKVKQIDDYHGAKVNDPYRWLEDDNSNETKTWVIEQNKITQKYLSVIPYKEKMKNRLTELWNYEKMNAPFKKGNYLFSYRNDGLQNQWVLYRQTSLLDNPEVVLDPNLLSTDGTTALSNFSISKDGKYLAYAISKAGSDWEEIHIKDLSTLQDLTDVVKWVKFSGMAWKGNGFYYSRYDEPKAGKDFTGLNQFHKIYFHQVGQNQTNDVLVYQDEKHGNRNFSAQTTDDENYLIVYGSETTSGSSLMIKDLSSSSNNFTILTDNFDSEQSVIDNIGSDFYMYTNMNASTFKLMKVSLKKDAQPVWTDVIPEQKDLLESVTFCGEHLVAKYLHHVSSKLVVYNLLGEKENDITLPDICQVMEVNSSREDKYVYYSTVSFINPTEVFVYDARTKTSKRVFKANTPIKSLNYVTEQVFYPSKDGTKIPMFITHKKGIELNGQNPCMVYAYGGFNVSLPPSYSPRVMMFLEAGGVYCVPNLRGGGEYGVDWHMAGTKCKKQNVFDDFTAACDYLVTNNYSSHQKIAISGGSNGGLLIGAVMTQRPDICKVALPAVGVLDMLRFHLFTIGRAWTVDYGCSESKEEFDCLYKYSPLHNVKSVEYPATMVLTGDHDDRVVPAHSFKFAATLQEYNKGKNPTLIRIDVNAGHGAGKPTSMQINEAVDTWSFVFYNLGVNY